MQALVALVLPVEVVVNVLLPRTYLAVESHSAIRAVHITFSKLAERHHEESAVGCELRAGERVLVRLGVDQLGVALHLETDE